MPLKKGSSPKIISQNISEFHTGPTYAATKAKFGKAKADKQAIAAAMSTARRYGKKKQDGGPVAGLAFTDPEEFKRQYYRMIGKEMIKEQSRFPSGSEQGPYERRKMQTKKSEDISDIVPRGKAFGGPNIESMIMRGASYGLRREGMINSTIPGRTDKIPMRVPAGSYILAADIPSALGQGNSLAGGEILKRMFNAGPYGLPTMRSAGRSGMSLAPRMSMRTPRPPKGMFAEGGETEGEDENHVPIVAAGMEYIVPPEVVKDVGHGSIDAGHRVLDRFQLNVRKKNIETLKKLPGPKK